MPSVRILVFLVLTTISLSAEQITLSNGDRLTGTILKSDGTTLTLKTTLAGTVEIQWSGIKELTSDQALVVTGSSSSQPASGVVAAKDGTVTITSSTGTKSIPQSEVKALRSPAEQVAYEKSLHPNLMHGWNGGINLGFALTGGNSETSNLAIAFFAARPTSTDKLSLYENTVYSKNNAPGAVPSTTASNNQGGIRYDHDITPRLF